MNDQQRKKCYSGIDDDPITLEAVRPRSSSSRVQTDYDEQFEDESLYSTRQPSSARRYQNNVPKQPSYVVTRPRQQQLRRPNQYDNVNVYVRRKSAQTPRPPSAPRQTEPVQDDDEQQTEPLRSTSPVAHQKPRWRFHWLVYVGVGMVTMFVLWFVLSGVLNWWNTTQDDLHYGRPRTAQYDVKVGHNDAHTPSHFLALNLHRHIEVIELPGGDASHAKVYIVASMLQEGNDLAVVTLSFKDLTHHGKLDMIVTVGNDTFVFINANGQFRPVQPGDNITTL